MVRCSLVPPWCIPAPLDLVPGPLGLDFGTNLEPTWGLTWSNFGQLRPDGDQHGCKMAQLRPKMALNCMLLTKMDHLIYENSLFFLRNLYDLGMSALMQSLTNLEPPWINFYPTWGILGPNLDQLGANLGHPGADLGHLGPDLSQLKATSELS